MKYITPAKLSMVRGLGHGYIFKLVSVGFYEKLKRLVRLDWPSGHACYISFLESPNQQVQDLKYSMLVYTYYTNLQMNGLKISTNFDNCFLCTECDEWRPKPCKKFWLSSIPLKNTISISFHTNEKKILSFTLGIKKRRA